MNAIPWKKLLPIVAAVALFYTLSLVYFSPVLEGKRLVMGDIRNWQGMAQEVNEHRDRTGGEALWTGSMFSGMPAYQISVIWTGNLLRHAHTLFSGFLPRPASFLFLYLVGMYVLLRILRVDPWLSIVGAIAYGLSSYFIIILEAGHASKANAIGYMPMVLGGVWLLYRGHLLWGAIGLGLFFGLELTMNHVQVTYYLSILLLFFVLAEGVRFVRERRVLEFVQRSAVGLVAVALAVAANVGLLWSTYEYGRYSTRGASELTIKPDGSPASDIRTAGLDRDYVTEWSYGLQESFTLLVPDVKGGATGMIGNEPSELARADARYRQNIAQMNRYWGDQRFTSGPVYLGAIVVLLMLLMLVRTEGPARWWLLGALPLLLVIIQVQSAPLAFLLIMAYLLAGLVLWKDTLAYALFAALVLTLVLSWGRNFMPLTDFFLDHVPGYAKFRAVTIILVVVELAAPVLGVLFLDRLLREDGWDRGSERRALIGTGALLVVLLAFAVAPGSLTDLISLQEREAFNRQADESPQMEAQVVAFVDALKEVRGGILAADAWRGFFFVLGAGVLVFLFGRRKVTAPVLIGGIGLLVLVDQWSVAKRYVNNRKEQGRYVQWEDKRANERPFKPTTADLAILEAGWGPAAEEDLQAQLVQARQRTGVVPADEQQLMRFASLRRNGARRVITLSNPFNDSRVSYFHRSLGGYHGAKLKRYQELIEFHLGPAVARLSGILRSGATPMLLDSLLAGEGVLNMLDAKWLIYNPERPPIENRHALGSAWLVRDVQWVPDADTEIRALGSINMRTTATVDERYRTLFVDPPAVVDSMGTVRLTSYATDAQTYAVRSTSGGVVVFSEIHYDPDWQAYVDGRPVPHARANYVLRALQVPPGEHVVEFRIQGRVYERSRPIAMAASALLILLAIGMVVQGVRRPSGTS